MKKMIWIRSSVGVLILSGAIAFAQGSDASAPAAKPVTTKAKSTAAPQDPGEKAFQDNCSRCHNAPEQISPRIAGTIVRHMRVRASLSAEDERAILRYLAP